MMLAKIAQFHPSSMESFEWGSLQDFLVAFLKDRGVSALAIFKPIPWPTLYWSKPRRS